MGKIRRGHGQSIGLEPPGFKQANLVEIVQSLGPRQLQKMREFRDLSVEADFEEEPDLHEESSDPPGDGDMACGDEDVDSPELEEDKRGSDSAAVIQLGSRVQIYQSPILSMPDVYAITVTKMSDPPTFRCRFTPPTWMMGIARDDEWFDPIRRHVRFVTCLSTWLEKNKLPFLASPTTHNFVVGDVGGGDPIVTQLGLLSRVNGAFSGPNESEYSTVGLNRLLDNLWLVWSTSSMPVSEFFSYEFQIAWVREALAAKGITPSQALRQKSRDVGAFEQKKVFTELCNKVRLKADTVLSNLL